MKLIKNTFYLTQYTQNIVISTCNRYKIIEIFYIKFLVLSLKSNVYFILIAPFSLD